jgi:transposase InsO family protein
MLYKSLGISKQAVHKQIDKYYKHQEMKAQLIYYIQEIRKDHPTLGVRDLYFKIAPEFIGRDNFEAFCREHGLMSISHKKWRPKTTNSSGVIRFENLLLGLKITHINQVWQSDITYFELKKRFYYITFIVDAYSRRIIGHQTSKSMSTDQTTLPALKKSIKTRSGKCLKGLIFHSDGGGQYYANAFREVVNQQGIRSSMCEYAWENGKAERVNGIIKNNYLAHWNISSFEALVKMVDRAVQLYNYDKPHKMLKRLTPIEFEEKMCMFDIAELPTMTESLDAKQNNTGFEPYYSEQNKPQNRDVLSASNGCII